MRTCLTGRSYSPIRMVGCLPTNPTMLFSRTAQNGMFTWWYGYLSLCDMYACVVVYSLAVASHDSGTHGPTAVVATRRLRWSEHGLCTKLLLAVAWMLALAMILFWVWVWVWVEPLMRHGRVV